MILSVMQPTFLPWIGYFDLIDSADTFVFLDNVKLEKSSWQVRNRIRSAQGELMLSAPVLTPQGRLNTTIAEAQFKAGHPWKKSTCVQSMITTEKRHILINSIHF